MNKMTTEEAFVKVLQMHGIEHAFGIIGSAMMPISDLFPTNGFNFWDRISSFQQEACDFGEANHSFAMEPLIYDVMHDFGIVVYSGITRRDMVLAGKSWFGGDNSPNQQEEIGDIEFKAEFLRLIVLLLISSIFRVHCETAWPEYVENLGGKPIRATNLVRAPPLIYV